MANTLIRLTHARKWKDAGVIRSVDDPYTGVAEVANAVDAMNAGVLDGKLEVAVDAAVASGTWTVASGTGALTCVINGVTINRTWATSDTATATALVGDINGHANSLIKDHVSATNAAGVVTITSKTPGLPGNAITLAGTGTGVTVSGARLTGGTETNYKSYNRGM